MSLFQPPRLFAQRLFQRWLQRRSPKAAKVTLNQRQVFILPTTSGLVFLAMAAALFIGGINYANSLILLVAFLLISLFLVAILHTFTNLCGLTLSVKPCQNTFAGGQALIVLQLAAQLRKRDGTTEKHSRHASIRLLWGESPPVMVDLLKQSRVEAPMLHPVYRRGRFVPPRLRIESQYPLGLLSAWSLVELDCQCLVYPMPEPCSLPAQGANQQQWGEQVRVQGQDDFAGLRPYQPGDNPRHIAWRNYARTYAHGGELHSRQFVSHSSATFWLEWSQFPGRAVEQRLSCLCYWVCQLTEQGRIFGLRIPGQSIEPGQGAQHQQQCLTALALFGEEKGRSSHV